MRLATLSLISFIFILIPGVVWCVPRVALLTELSGQYASNGSDCRKGYEIAADFSKNLSKTPPRIFYGDTQGDPKVALAEMRKMVQVDRVSVVVVNRSQVGMAMAAVSDSLGMPLVGSVGHSDFIKDYKFTFRAWPNARREGETLAKAAFKRGVRRIAVVTAEDEYLDSLSKHFKETFVASGGTIAYSQSILQSEYDFATYVSSLKHVGVDAIFVNLSIPQLGPFLKRVDQHKIELPILSNYWIQKPEVLSVANHTAEGVVFVEVDIKAPQFLRAFQSRFGEPPNLMTSYACFIAATTAIGAAETTVTATLANLQRTAHVKTPDGDLKLLQREVDYLLVAKTIRNGRVELLSGN